MVLSTWYLGGTSAPLTTSVSVLHALGLRCVCAAGLFSDLHYAEKHWTITRGSQDIDCSSNMYTSCMLQELSPLVCRPRGLFDTHLEGTY